MRSAQVNGVELEFEVVGSGEPVLLVSPVLADGFVPLLTRPRLRDHFALISYHKRGWVGSTRTPGPVTVAQHAADAEALLDALGFDRAHVAGHSSGAVVALQLALEAPSRVASLALLEPSILSLPEGQAFLSQAAPVIEKYERGDSEAAVAAFLSAVSGLAWEDCRDLLEAAAPGVVDQTVKDAPTMFEVELPGLMAWPFDASDAAAVEPPVLSVLGSRTQPLWLETAAFLREWVPGVREVTIRGAGHLLHLERPGPVAVELARFWREHRIG